MRSFIPSAFLIVTLVGCGTTQMWGDSDSADGIPDPTNEPRTDAPDADDDTNTPDVAEDVIVSDLPDLPPDDCASVCAFMLGCEASGTNCLTFCERASEYLRACLLEALADGDCAAIDACYTDVVEPPECDPICEFVAGCTFIIPIATCEDGCSLMSSEVHDCAEAAMEADDCQGVLDCMLYPGGVEDQCDSVCDFALTGCGLDLGVTPELCSLGCQSGLLIEPGLLDCLGYGAMLRSCLALAGCAALMGYTMP
jgi:hypothetical protein